MTESFKNQIESQKFGDDFFTKLDLWDSTLKQTCEAAHALIKEDKVVVNVLDKKQIILMISELMSLLEEDNFNAYIRWQECKPHLERFANGHFDGISALDKDISEYDFSAAWHRLSQLIKDWDVEK